MQLLGQTFKVEKPKKSKSDVQIIVEVFLDLKEISYLPQKLTPEKRKQFYGKLMREARETLDAYKVWGGALDDILRDLSQLAFEAKSKGYNFSIRTLTKPNAKWNFTY